MNKDNLFLIKTHPAEKNEVYEKYFEGRDNIIVLPKKYDIFDAFSIADVHLTCWSTCAYEAILFGVRTILIPTRSSSDLADLIENDIAQIGDSVEDMDKMISSKSKLKKDQIEAYYASVNPYKTIIEFVRKMKV
jgi:CDP-glycerol glycerophosphotransferase (TagB/SpsB family)